MAPVTGVLSVGGEYEGGGSAGVVEKGLVGRLGRRVEGEGLVKVGSGCGCGLDIFADVDLEVMVDFL